MKTIDTIKLNYVNKMLEKLQNSHCRNVLTLLCHHGEMSVNRISYRLGVPHSTISFTLSNLKHYDLVSGRSDGRNVFYKANTRKIEKINTAILELNKENETATTI